MQQFFNKFYHTVPRRNWTTPNQNIHLVKLGPGSLLGGGPWQSDACASISLEVKCSKHSGHCTVDSICVSSTISFGWFTEKWSWELKCRKRGINNYLYCTNSHLGPLLCYVTVCFSRNVGNFSELSMTTLDVVEWFPCNNTNIQRKRTNKP